MDDTPHAKIPRDQDPPLPSGDELLRALAETEDPDNDTHPVNGLRPDGQGSVSSRLVPGHAESVEFVVKVTPRQCAQRARNWPELIALQSPQAYPPAMSDSITIRNLPPGLKEKLRVRAAERGHSMEAEARRILQTALAAPRPSGRNLYERVRARFAPLGGVELDLPPREPAREPPQFG